MLRASSIFRRYNPDPMLRPQARWVRLLVIAVVLGGAVAGCTSFRPEPSTGTFQPYKDPQASPPPPPAPAGPPVAERLVYRARSSLLNTCAAPLELSVRQAFGERRGNEVTVVVEAHVSNPHGVPVTVERQLRLRAGGGGVELPFWQQFDARRGRAVASNGGGLVLLPVDTRENDGFTGPEQRTLPAGGRARTPTVTYKGLLGRGEETTLDLLAESRAARGGGCLYRVQLRRQ
jgi:hypothetical protein